MHGKRSISWNCLSYWSRTKGWKIWSWQLDFSLSLLYVCFTGYIGIFSFSRGILFAVVCSMFVFQMACGWVSFFMFHLCFAVWPVQNSHGKYRPPGLLVVTFWSSLHRSWPGIIISSWWWGVFWGERGLFVFIQFTIIILFIIFRQRTSLLVEEEVVVFTGKSI